jgi:hypothetical protein
MTWMTPAYEAAEEAVYNCLVAERPPMRKRDGREHPQFPRHLLSPSSSGAVS